jgi:uncharacterized membrane protein
MCWKQRYAAKSYLRSALWIIPLVALVLEQIAIRLASTFDASLTWAPRLARTAAGTAGVMDTVVTLDISFIVFTFGSMLVAIQVASGQMTPRIIATALLRDNFIRCILSSRENPKIGGIDDAEVVGDLVAVDMPVPRHLLAQKS